MQPRIGIPVPTSKDAAYNQRSWGAYAAAVAMAGAAPVELRLGATTAELNALAGRCDGFVLPGSPADVDPARYGAEREAATAAMDAQRERMDIGLLEHAQRYAKPLLGICFGMQSMNVWRGGTLVQDLMPVPVNHAAGAQVAVAHAAVVAQGSLLGSLLEPLATETGEVRSEGGFWRVGVNSSHHQAIGIAGQGLRVVARCPEDGVVEAVEWEPDAGMFHVEHKGNEQFLLGVQWHPERSCETSSVSRAIFSRLVEEARLSAAVLAARRAHGSRE